MYRIDEHIRLNIAIDTTSIKDSDWLRFLVKSWIPILLFSSTVVLQTNEITLLYSPFA